MISIQVFPTLALDKEYESYEIKHLFKPVHTNRSYVETDNSLKTSRYFELILVDTGSVEIERKRISSLDIEQLTELTILLLLMRVNSCHLGMKECQGLDKSLRITLTKLSS